MRPHTLTYYNLRDLEQETGLPLWDHIFRFSGESEYYYFCIDDDEIQDWKDEIKDLQDETDAYSIEDRYVCEMKIALAKYIRKNTRETCGIVINIWS